MVAQTDGDYEAERETQSEPVPRYEERNRRKEAKEIAVFEAMEKMKTAN